MKLGVISWGNTGYLPGFPVKKYRLQRLGFPTNDINKPGGDCSWVGGVFLLEVQYSILKSLISTCVLSYVGSREDWLLDRICESKKGLLG